MGNGYAIGEGLTAFGNSLLGTIQRRQAEQRELQRQQMMQQQQHSNAIDLLTRENDMRSAAAAAAARAQEAQRARAVQIFQQGANPGQPGQADPRALFEALSLLNPKGLGSWSSSLYGSDRDYMAATRKQNLDSGLESNPLANAKVGAEKALGQERRGAAYRNVQSGNLSFERAERERQTLPFDLSNLALGVEQEVARRPYYGDLAEAEVRTKQNEAIRKGAAAGKLDAETDRIVRMLPTQEALELVKLEREVAQLQQDPQRFALEILEREARIEQLKEKARNLAASTAEKEQMLPGKLDAQTAGTRLTNANAAEKEQMLPGKLDAQTAGTRLTNANAATEEQMLQGRLDAQTAGTRLTNANAATEEQMLQGRLEGQDAANALTMQQVYRAATMLPIDQQRAFLELDLKRRELERAPLKTAQQEAELRQTEAIIANVVARTAGVQEDTETTRQMRPGAVANQDAQASLRREQATTESELRGVRRDDIVSQTRKRNVEADDVEATREARLQEYRNRKELSAARTEYLFAKRDTERAMLTPRQRINEARLQQIRQDMSIAEQLRSLTAAEIASRLQDAIVRRAKDVAETRNIDAQAALREVERATYEDLFRDMRRESAAKDDWYRARIRQIDAGIKHTEGTAGREAFLDVVHRFLAAKNDKQRRKVLESAGPLLEAVGAPVAIGTETDEGGFPFYFEQEVPTFVPGFGPPAGARGVDIDDLINP